jgi:hypothetical protein
MAREKQATKLTMPLPTRRTNSKKNREPKNSPRINAY